MFYIGLILFIIAIIILFFSWHQWKILKEENNIVVQRNEDIEKENLIICQKNDYLKAEQCELNKNLNQLKEISNNLNSIAQQAFESYCDELDHDYVKKEQEYNQYYLSLTEAYQLKQLELLSKIKDLENNLEDLSKTRAAALEAQLKEQEIKEQKNFYSIKITETDLKDAKILRDIEYKLNNPRVLRMLIWQSFYQKPMTQLCNNVVGPTAVSGIYKITNQITDSYYIGQSLDISERWKKHAKCGLGIDTPASNKLYQNMMEYGLENFTFEILEKCKPNELDAKEKFYISLYQADKFGLNSKGGNG